MYVNTELNPADDASRGVPADSLERWIEGPEFLRQSNESWPKRPADMGTKVENTDLQVKGPIVFANQSREPHPLTGVIERYSSWNRLKRIVAWSLRYKANCYVQPRSERLENQLSVRKQRR
jgi:hypothetical protein